MPPLNGAGGRAAGRYCSLAAIVVSAGLLVLLMLSSGPSPRLQEPSPRVPEPSSPRVSNPIVPTSDIPLPRLLGANQHNHSCNGSRYLSVSYSEGYMEKFNAFRAHLSSLHIPIVEGYSEQVPLQYALYQYLVRRPGVTTVCETGFNAGHSAFQWLAVSPTTTLHSFDLCEYKFAQPMASYLNTTFPGRLHLTCGDSKVTLAAARARLAAACDLVIVDGGHTTEVAAADIKNMAPLASPGHVLVVDDVPSLPGPLEAWQAASAAGLVTEDVMCHVNDRGFVVGRYKG